MIPDSTDNIAQLYYFMLQNHGNGLYECLQVSIVNIVILATLEIPSMANCVKVSVFSW